jgi:hypothetical protein
MSSEVVHCGLFQSGWRIACVPIASQVCFDIHFGVIRVTLAIVIQVTAERHLQPGRQLAQVGSLMFRHDLATKFIYLSTASVI